MENDLSSESNNLQIPKAITYTMEELEVIFEENRVKSHEIQIELYEKYKENNPDYPAPEHFLNEFNINNAFLLLFTFQ